MKRRDLTTNVGDKVFTVRNIPYENYDAEGEEFVDIGVALKIAMIRDLMDADEIPYDVDYTKVEDLKFSTEEDE